MTAGAGASWKSCVRLLGVFIVGAVCDVSVTRKAWKSQFKKMFPLDRDLAWSEIWTKQLRGVSHDKASDIFIRPADDNTPRRQKSISKGEAEGSANNNIQGIQHNSVSCLE